MIRIKYVQASGAEHEIEAECGQTVMEAALANNVPGIDGDCGGNCACGTCHVYIEPAWLDAMPQPRDDELEMLNFAAACEPNSRLGCQIRIEAAHDGIVVRLPAGQH
jgi:ferredoxin, 2Fe-2S